jgi:ElaB/YqjD/DUF883 family membrane-anchored ribosome-binding protein
MNMPPEISTDQLVADLRKLTSDMELLLAEGGSIVKDRLGDASSALESRLRRAKSRLEHLGRHTSRRLKRTARDVDRYAHDNPWQLGGASIVTGVVLGIVIGLALASRRD